MKLTQEQIDALKELGSIGSGNATTALSKLLGKRIDISVPESNVTPLQDIPELIGNANDPASVMCIRLTEPFEGSVMLVFSIAESYKLADMLLGKEIGTTNCFDDLSESALKELSNITIGSYLNAVSVLIEHKLLHSIPYFVTDIFGAILDGIIIELAVEVEEAVLVQTRFEIANHEISGHIIFLPRPEGLKHIITRLGDKI